MGLVKKLRENEGAPLKLKTYHIAIAGIITSLFGSIYLTASVLTTMGFYSLYRKRKREQLIEYWRPFFEEVEIIGEIQGKNEI